jgi:rhomboid protease GluP
MAQKKSAVLCSSCRQLISAAETACPYCKAAQPTLWGAAPTLQGIFRDLDLTRILSGLCVALYLVSMVLSPETLQNRGGGLFNLLSPGQGPLLMLGLTGGEAWRCGHVWTVFTANYLHGSVLHILFNLMWLRSLGGMVTELLGPARLFVVFTLSGVGGFLLSNVLWGMPTLGASAGVFGLLGALLVFGKRRGGTLGKNLSGQMVGWAVSTLAWGLLFPGINNTAHLGGLAAGALVARFLPSHEGRFEGRGVQLLALALAAITVAAFAANLLTTAGPALRGEPICGA